MVDEMNEIKYQKPYTIRLKSGVIVTAILLRLNKYCGKKEVWKRLGDVPRKQRYIDLEEVEEVISPFVF